MVNEDREATERLAAEYLVEQIKEMQDERERFAIENENLHLQTQDLIDETKKLGGEIQEYQQYFEYEKGGNFMEEKQYGPSLAKMKTRIEELEDLIYEIKQTGNLNIGEDV